MKRQETYSKKANEDHNEIELQIHQNGKIEGLA